MGNTVGPDQELLSDQGFDANNGAVRFVFQGDGNLVLYRQADWIPLWSSKTNGSGADHCYMQGDGNLVIYAGGTPKWASNTAGHPGASLTVQDDSNVVIYENGQARWSTGTWSSDVKVEAKPWGVVITLSHSAAEDLALTGVASAAIVAAVGGVVSAGVLAAVGAGIAAVAGLVKAVDKGNGVYLTMLWPTPGIFFPTTRP